jgi:GT2 family glycosyltransferase
MLCPKISIIIPHMNGKEVLAECLHSIERVDYPNYDVIVVDNNSSDGSQTFVMDTFPNVQLIENKTNEGVAEGQNIGVRAALRSGADYVFIVNNDAILDRDILRELTNAIEQDKTIGVAGPILHSTEDMTRIGNAGGKIGWNTGNVRLLKVGAINKSLPKIEDVDYVNFFFADPSVLQNVGLFNKRYFAYWEDVDLCLRVKKAGYRVVRVSTAKVWHKSKSTSKKLSGFYEYHYTRNQFWFWKAYSTRRQWILFLFSFFFLFFWYRSIFTLFRNDHLKGIDVLIDLKAMCRGVRDGLLMSL